MREFQGSASTYVRATPDKVFDFVTDVDRLPDWNGAIERIVESPAVLEPGAAWVVVMHPRGMPSWKSRSEVEEIERATRFVYRSRTDDNNPSYARWEWDIVPAEDGAQVTVSWDAHPMTIGRRLIGAPIRRRMLAREVAASLDVIRRTLESPEAGEP
jgi:uncharacterized protein YndB with AHSA1/START domain